MRHAVQQQGALYSAFNVLDNIIAFALPRERGTLLDAVVRGRRDPSSKRCR